MALPSFGSADDAGPGHARGLGLAADHLGRRRHLVVALYYWTLRRNYSSLMEGAQLFEDLRKREQQALELNDSVLQGLVVAKMALDLDDTDKANAALTTSIDSASRIITNLLGSEHFSIELLRSAPAVVDLSSAATTSHQRERAHDMTAPDPAPAPVAS